MWIKKIICERRNFVSLLHQKFRFFCRNFFFEIFWKESEEILYQIEIYLKKIENFTIYVYYSEEHHSVNAIFMSFYKELEFSRYGNKIVDIQNSNSNKIFNLRKKFKYKLQ